MTSIDNSIIENFLGSNILWKSYDLLSQETTIKINKILAEEYSKGTSIPNIRRKISNEITDLTKYRLDSIIRTEANNIGNISRETSYRQLDPENTRLYKMKGPIDNRTAESTLEVYQRQGNGLPLEELRSLVKEVAMKYNPKTYLEDRPWQIHINGRAQLSIIL